jgi:hypothetical protein
LPCSSISARYTLYPGQPSTFVQSFSLIGKVYPDSQNLKIPAKRSFYQILAQSLKVEGVFEFN